MTTQTLTNHHAYRKCSETSQRIRWDIDADVLRGRGLSREHKFMPDGLSLVHRLAGLSPAERLFFSQVQGRTYANLFGLVERFIAAKVLELSRAHALGDQTALAALLGFGGEELKHQELFRRVEVLAAAVMPPGYRLAVAPDDVAHAVLARSTWSVLALTCHIEIFTLAHYKESIEPDAMLSPVWKDVFFHHFREESQHAILDELEWTAEDARLDASARDAAVDDLIALVGAVDGILQAQAAEDARYFVEASPRSFSATEREEVGRVMLAAYRHQYIASGVVLERFQSALFGKIDDAQKARVLSALGPILA